MESSVQGDQRKGEPVSFQTGKKAINSSPGFITLPGPALRWEGAEEEKEENKRMLHKVSHSAPNN